MIDDKPLTSFWAVAKITILFKLLIGGSLPAGKNLRIINDTIH